MSSSTTETEIYVHRSKDGLWYDSPLAMVAANRACNEKVLKDLGLDQASKEKLFGKKRKSVIKRKQTTPAKDIRRSSRLRNVTPDHSGLKDEEEERAVMVSRPRKRAAKKHSTATPLSKQERQRLENLPDWTQEMETYLLQVEGISVDNCKQVMRQVGKMAAGIGISYHHWGTNVFAKGRSIGLTEDFPELNDEAVEFENDHGKDLGNGRCTRTPQSSYGYTCVENGSCHSLTPLCFQQAGSYAIQSPSWQTFNATITTTW
jgi:hypothetical protein